jgi:Flp pilus assembly pilin Flp
MKNLMEKYTSEAVEATNEDGVVAIEYVLVAGIVAAGIATVALTGIWTELKTKLDNIIP